MPDPQNKNVEHLIAIQKVVVNISILFIVCKNILFIDHTLPEIYFKGSLAVEVSI